MAKKIVTFERFELKTQKAVMLAQEESRQLGNNFVGIEQLVVALVGETRGWEDLMLM